MKATYHTEIQQGTEAWHDLRRGRVGGSECSSFFSYPTKPEKMPSGLESLAYAKAAELIVPGVEDDRYESDAMLWGTEFEPVAREAFENDRFITVEQVGYISYGKYFGFSPDGITGHEDNSKALIEIKCPAAKEWIRFDKTKKIKKEYEAQIYWGLNITDLCGADFVCYHPFLGLSTAAVALDAATVSLLEIRMKMYSDLMDELLTKYQL